MVREQSGRVDDAMSQPLDDDSLLQKAAGGDAEALESLLLAEFDRVAADVGRRIPEDVRAALSAEDVVQDAYIVAFQRMGEFEPRGRAAFFAWLCQIAQHRLLDATRALRAAKRGGGWERAAEAADSDGIVSALELLPNRARTPSRAAATNEALAVLEQSLLALDPHYRDVLRMRFIEMQPVATCAEKLQRSEGAVHMLISRALAALRAQMGESARFFTRKA